jgi:hypothetical protein
LLIDLSKRFRHRVREFPKPRRREIARVIDAVRDGFGAPHVPVVFMTIILNAASGCGCGWSLPCASWRSLFHHRR